MHSNEWLPIYRTICSDFGFDPRSDRLARDRLAELASPFDLDRIDMSGQIVAVAGGGPSLESDRRLVECADTVVAASDAADRLASVGIRPDLIVTDLDGRPDRTVDLAERGVPVAAHAHGDNVGAIETYCPQIPDTHLLGTTQADPVWPLCNYGGFTDGDRAAYLADALGATRLLFPGWAFDDPDVTPFKRRKLRWAERLLAVLERRRDERFDVLDGRRSRIDLRRLTGK